MGLDHRFVNVREDLGSGISYVEIRDDLDGLAPTGRCRRDFHRLLLILLDTYDRLAQPTVHVWIARQVLAHGIAHAREFAFYDALLGFTTRSQQHLAISRAEALMCVSDRVRGESQPSCQYTRSGLDRLVGGVSCKVHRHDQKNQQDPSRHRRPGRESQQACHGHVSARLGSWMEGRRSLGRRCGSMLLSNGPHSRDDTEETSSRSELQSNTKGYVLDRCVPTSARSRSVRGT